MTKQATVAEDLTGALNADTLPFVYASSLATWRRDGPVLFLGFVEHRPLVEALGVSRSVSVARIMIPVASLERTIAVLQDALEKVRLGDAAAEKIGVPTVN